MLHNAFIQVCLAVLPSYSFVQFLFNKQKLSAVVKPATLVI